MSIIYYSFILTSIIAAITFISYKGKMLSRLVDTAQTWLLSAVVISIVFIIMYAISYTNYIDAKQDKVSFDLVLAQLVNNYTKYADLPTGAKNPKMASDLTDQKYEGYQDNLKAFMVKVSATAVSINNTIVAKEHMKNTTFWSPLIYYPEKIELVELPKFKNLTQTQ